MNSAAPEQEVDCRHKVLLMLPEGRNLIAQAVLTSERIIYGRELFADLVPRGVLVRLAEQKIQQAYDRRSGGPTELLRLGEIKSLKRVRRRMRGDIFQISLSDGRTASIGALSAKGWDEEIRRLLVDELGRTVTDEEGGWRVD